MTAALRIFSYLPNPRIWKATITARLCGVEVEVRGDAPAALPGWLWDFDAHPLSPDQQTAAKALQREARKGFGGALFKTEAFLVAHPYGNVPAAFSPDGLTGIFESNSIMRSVARLGGDAHGLYGHDAYSASRIDSFLDVSLLFARDTQRYVLALRAGTIGPELHAETSQALDVYLGGIERALTTGGGAFLVAPALSLADICFVAELALLHNEALHHALLNSAGLAPLLGDALGQRFPRAVQHYAALCDHPAFAPDLAPFMAALSGPGSDLATP